MAQVILGECPGIVSIHLEVEVPSLGLLMDDAHKISICDFWIVDAIEQLLSAIPSNAGEEQSIAISFQMAAEIVTEKVERFPLNLGRHAVRCELLACKENRQVPPEHHFRFEVRERLIDDTDRRQSFILPLKNGKDLIRNIYTVFHNRPKCR